MSWRANPGRGWLGGSQLGRTPVTAKPGLASNQRQKTRYVPEQELWLHIISTMSTSFLSTP